MKTDLPQANGKNGARARRELDWDVIRQRVLDMGDRLAAGPDEEADLEALEAVWQQRAIQLAKVPEQEEAGQQIELVLVRIGREIYGLEVQYVHDIRPLVYITRVPRTPDWVAGIVNVRGRILTALSLQHFFGLPNGSTGAGAKGAGTNGAYGGENSARQFLVLVELPEDAQTAQRESALVVQDVLSVLSFNASHIQDTPGTIRGIRPEFVRGVTTLEEDSDSLLVVLNLPAILNDKQMIIREELL